MNGSMMASKAFGTISMVPTAAADSIATSVR
jgi:hypothetical protein